MCSSVHIIADFSTASQAFLALSTQSFRLGTYIATIYGVYSALLCKAFCFGDYMHFPLPELSKFQPMKILKKFIILKTSRDLIGCHNFGSLEICFVGRTGLCWPFFFVTCCLLVCALLRVYLCLLFLFPFAKNIY